MTINTPTVLASKVDNNSFFVPSIGFTDASAATLYSANRDCLTVSCVTGMDDTFACVTLGTKTYVPRISFLTGPWLTSDLVTASGPQTQTKWVLLRDKAHSMPSADAFNTCLLIDGPRQFSNYYPRSTKHPNWWYDLHMGYRDCFAVWGRYNGETLGNHDPLDGRNHITSRSHGRGVIFAHTAQFSNSGELAGFRNILVVLDFSTKDKDGTTDDMLRVEIKHHWALTSVGEGFYDFTKDERDSGLRILIERAQRGFALHCKSVPQEIDTWRKFFVEQQAHIAEGQL